MASHHYNKTTLSEMMLFKDCLYMSVAGHNIHFYLVYTQKGKYCARGYTCFILVDNSQRYFLTCINLYFHQQCKSSNCFKYFPKLGIVNLFPFNHSREYVVISYFSLFAFDHHAGHPFMFITYSEPSFIKYLFTFLSII